MSLSTPDFHPPPIFSARDLEYESQAAAPPPVAIHAAPAAAWCRVTPELFDVLVGKRVRWIADDSVPLTGINVETSVLGARSAGKVGVVDRCDSSDSTVKVKLDGNDCWYSGECHRTQRAI